MENCVGFIDVVCFEHALIDYCVTKVMDFPDRPARAVLPTRWM